MRIGVPKETKDHEYRVGITPAGACSLTQSGHDVHVQSGAGARIGFADSDYAKAGAKIVVGAREVYAREFIVKVKEMQPEEFGLLREGQILFGYLHLAKSFGPTPKAGGTADDDLY